MENTPNAFDEFCNISGIKRQLINAYTLEQNGVSKTKNKIVMNMVRCTLTEKNITRVSGLKQLNGPFMC